MSNKISYRGLFTEKQYMKLVTANLVSRFGDSLDMIAFGWVMYEITKSASMLALITAINFLPNVLLGPFTGVLADRFSKKKLMIGCDLVRAAIVTLTAVGYLLGWLNPPLLILITLVNSTVESFRNPASAALVPKILEREKYTLGTAFNQSFSRIMELIGTACAGGIIALIGSSGALLIDAATFLFSAGMIAFIRYQEELETVPLHIKRYFSKLSEGFQFMKTSPFLLCLVLIGAFMNFSMSPINAFNTIYIADTLKQGPWILSMVGVALTGGMAVGAFFLPRLKVKFQGKRVFLAAGFLTAVSLSSLWLIPLADSQWVILGALAVAYFLLGTCAGIQNAIFGADLMEAVDSKLMGRITSLVNAVLLSMAPLGALLCSGMAGFLSVPVIFLIFGVINAATYWGSNWLKPLKDL